MQKVRIFTAHLTKPLDIFNNTEYADVFVENSAVICSNSSSYIECLEEAYEVMDKDWRTEVIPNIQISTATMPSLKVVEYFTDSEDTEVWVVTNRDKPYYVHKVNEAFYLYKSLEEMLNGGFNEPYKAFRLVDMFIHIRSLKVEKGGKDESRN